MRLHKLSSNKPTFRTTTFNPTGLSIILGRRTSLPEDEDEHTYNGIGKSLLLYLVNFCLGSTPKEDFLEKLEGWSFTLEFSLFHSPIPTQHVVTRTIDDPDTVILNGVATVLEDYKSYLGIHCFRLAEKTNFLTFRTLLGLFLRSGRAAYSSYDRINFGEKPYQRLLRNSYLMGLDLELVRTKHDLREELDSARLMAGKFEKDPHLRAYFQGTKDVTVDLREMEDEFHRLENDLKNFRIADNYKEIEVKANDLRRDIQAIRNEMYLVDASIAQISESLEKQPHLSLDNVRQVYEAAKIKLPDVLVRSLAEVNDFHSTLLAERERRLKADFKKVQKQKADLDVRLLEKNALLDESLRFLKEHGALGEYLTLSDRIADLRNQVQRLRDYKTLMHTYRTNAQEMRVRLSEESLKASKYLLEAEPKINAVTGLFRSYSRQIYPGKYSALTIENDDGDSQTRFEIEAKILADSSDGINEVKIFCFDLMVLAARQNHEMGFLFHDSRLFSDIDPRQRANLFKLAYGVAAEQQVQYISTLSQDQAETMREWFGQKEYAQVILNSIVGELGDKDATERLLGIEIDLKYD